MSDHHETKRRKYTLLQVVNGHVFEFDLLGTIDISSIRKNADGHARAGHVREPSPKNISCYIRRTIRKTYLTVPEKRLSLWGS
jgi:hypothetical protein